VHGKTKKLRRAPSTEGVLTGRRVHGSLHMGGEHGCPRESPDNCAKAKYEQRTQTINTGLSEEDADHREGFPIVFRVSRMGERGKSKCLPAGRKAETGDEFEEDCRGGKIASRNEKKKSKQA